MLVACRSALAQESCVSAQCHATLLKAKTVHPATESCESCHESVAKPHPQKAKKTFKLSAEPPGLCEGCHEPFGKKTQVHPPAKEGMCTTCHDPHASNQPDLLVEPMPKLCASCHPDVTQFKYLHGPASSGECLSCHEAHESNTQPLLKSAGEELCFGCHGDVQELLAKKNVHPALSSGCTTCHSPHGANNPMLMEAGVPQLCYQCHDPIGAKIDKGPTVHAAVKDGKGCMTCHNPHASDYPSLLPRPQEASCLECHKSIVTQSMTLLHAPIKEGKCTPCHDPHASQYPRLLVQEFPTGPYAPYTDQQYALCFSCHKRDMVEYPDTSFATGFRDGERNLHYLHVNNPKKGRSCVLCHAVHGSSSPELVAQSVTFGKWTLPIKFVKTETGGSCAPGCHRPLSYDRKNPGKKPETPKPPAKTG
jgi:predicted CXXCH cytochrome family protein